MSDERILSYSEGLELRNGPQERGRPLRRLYFTNLVSIVPQDGR